LLQTLLLVLLYLTPIAAYISLNYNLKFVKLGPGEQLV